MIDKSENVKSPFLEMDSKDNLFEGQSRNLGKITDVPANGFYQQGMHMVSWDASNFPSGRYYVRLNAPGFRAARRMILLK